MEGLSTADKSKPYIPLAGMSNDGYSREDEATATCYCGAVQLAFPTKAPGLVEGGNHVCNCTDCHKLHSSMLGANFVVLDSHLKHLRGKEVLKVYGGSKTTTTSNNMDNYFCSTCGTLMYRIGTGFPGKTIMRVGTVDDFSLMETVLRPTIEQFTKDRVSWLAGTTGTKHVEDYNYK